MQLNQAYQPKVSDKDRAAAMAEAALLLQEVSDLVVAKHNEQNVWGGRMAYFPGRNS